MRSSIALAAIAAAFVLTAVDAGFVPALCQDFSITNQVEPADAGRRDLMRQLQAWWDVHAYYPKHASNNDEGGTVKVHLAIRPDGNISAVNVVDGSGSTSLDTAAISAFQGGFVQPFPESAPEVALDLSLHYVLAHRHDQPVVAGYTSVPSKRPFHYTERSSPFAYSRNHVAKDLYRNSRQAGNTKSSFLRSALLGPSGFLSQP